jgi:predicted permease
VDHLSGRLRPILLVLLGAVLFVLLIACANVASLQLVRTTGRAREIAVRAALGAGRWPIVREFLVESLVYALLGGLLGVALGALALRLLSHFDVAEYEALRDLRLDGAVLALTAGVTLLAGLLFGVVPAWRASRVNAHEVLSASGGRGASLGSARSRFLQATVVAQVALTLVLLLGSGVMLRSLAAQLAVDPGFRAEQALAMQIAPPRSRYPREQRLALYDRILERLRAVPGLDAVALTSKVPFSDMLLDSSPLTIPGAPPLADGEQPHANAMSVTPDYVRAMGVRVVQGRAFTDADRGTPVAMVDEQLARQYFPDGNAVGRQIDHYGFQGVTIVGVVRSVDQAELGGEAHPTVYYPYTQLPYAWGAVVVRSTLPTGTVTTMVRQALREIDPELPVYDARPMTERVASSLGARRLAVGVLGGFAALALVLALLGTYGVLSYGTSQRTRELGIRLALGAQPGAVVGMVLRGGLLLAGVGLALGVVAYLGLGRLLQSVVYGVSPRDPVTLALGVAVLLGAALVACWIPARRAARVDAIVALRAE